MKVAVCAVAKNENKYIKEWVEHYKSIGVSHIFVYDNNDINGERFEEVINDYIESCFVEVINMRGRRFNQSTLYFDNYNKYKSLYDYICYFDIDEFLVFDKIDLNNYLNLPNIKRADVINVNWEIYDDNDLLDYDERPVVERFTRKCTKQIKKIKDFDRDNYQVKSIVKCSSKKLLSSSTHKFSFEQGIYVNSCGEDVSFSYPTKFSLDKICHKYVKLNHYLTKTIGEFVLRKMLRGGMMYDHSHTIEQTIEDFKIINNITPAKTQKAFEIKKYLDENGAFVPKIGIVCVAKNENKYIREWVNYHIQLGFYQIIICDNNDINGEQFEEAIGDYIESGQVLLENYRGQHQCQKDSYNYCLKKYSEVFDWLAFIDCDEFIHLEKDNSIGEFLNNDRFRNYNAVRLCWKCYDDSDQLFPINGYTVTRFTHPISIDQTQCKTIFKCNFNVNDSNNNFTKSVHGIFNSSIKACDSVGRPCKNADRFIGEKPVYQNAWLNHYRYKTIYEFMEKQKRGYANMSYDLAQRQLSVNEFKKYNQWNAIKELIFNGKIKPVNIICNDCTGAEIYKKYIQSSIPNPFKWAHLPYDEFKIVVKNYNNLKFEDFEVIPINSDPIFKNGAWFDVYGDRQYYVETKEGVKMSYPHYIKSIQNDQIDQNPCNLYIDNIEDFISQKYKEKVQLMRELNIPPIFLMVEKSYSTSEQLDDFVNIKTPYIKILYTFNPKYKDLKQKNLYVYYNSSKPNWNVEFQRAAKIIYNEFIKDLMNNFQSSKTLEFTPFETQEEERQALIKKTKEEYEQSKKERVVYVARFGNDDPLPKIKQKENGIEYVCLTDHDIKSEDWIIYKIPKLSGVRTKDWSNVYCQFHPKQLLQKEYKQYMFIQGDVPENCKSLFAKIKYGDMACRATKDCVYDKVNDFVRRLLDNASCPHCDKSYQGSLMITDDTHKELLQNIWHCTHTNVSNRDVWLTCNLLKYKGLVMEL